MKIPGATPRRGPKPNLQTRENLLKAGVKLLHEGGYTASGVKDIVGAAAVPKGSFYNHFDSKEVFGSEVVDYYFTSGLEELRALLSDSKIPAIERLKTYFNLRTAQFRAQGYIHGCMLGNLSLEVSDHSSLIRERIAVHFQTWNRLIENCIAEGQRAGDIAHHQTAPMLARFILNSWEGALLRMRVEKSDEPLTDFTRIVFDQLLM